MGANRNGRNVVRTNKRLCHNPLTDIRNEQCQPAAVSFWKLALRVYAQSHFCNRCSFDLLLSGVAPHLFLLLSCISPLLGTPHHYFPSHLTSDGNRNEWNWVPPPLHPPSGDFVHRRWWWSPPRQFGYITGLHPFRKTDAPNEHVFGFRKTWKRLFQFLTGYRSNLAVAIGVIPAVRQVSTQRF